MCDYNMFVQWKGTDGCVDLHCVCGESYHYDGYFLFAWKCFKCGRTYEVPHRLNAKVVEDTARTLANITGDCPVCELNTLNRDGEKFGCCACNRTFTHEELFDHA